MAAAVSAPPAEGHKGEVFEYQAAWNIYAMNWSIKPEHPFRLAAGSFIEDYNNKVDVIQLNEETGVFQQKATFDHRYPATKLAWMPDHSGGLRDLLATSGDFLRIWEVGAGGTGVKAKCTLNNNKNSEYCAPLTSFDWNEVDPAIIGTASIDTTCTIWNIEREQAVTQLIAHDKEVYDIAFGRNSRDVFASVGKDGSVRLFDLRNLEHSTIIFETQDSQPLLRVAWNKQDDYYLAIVSLDSSKCTILDTRVPSISVAELDGHHQACLNSVAWAPQSSCHICTGGEDSRALIWDLSPLPNPIEQPIMAYTAPAEINQLQWSVTQPHWISIAYNSRLQILRV